MTNEIEFHIWAKGNVMHVEFRNDPFKICEKGIDVDTICERQVAACEHIAKVLGLTQSIFDVFDVDCGLEGRPDDYIALHPKGDIY